MLEALGLLSMLFVAAFTWRAARMAPGKGQSPLSSIIEAWVNIAIGFAINFAANLLILPMALPGGHLTLAANWWMGWIFTTVSILRQYAIRRWFNAQIHMLATRVGR